MNQLKDKNMINIVQDIGLIEYGTEGRKARHVLAKCPKCSTKFSTRLDNLKRRNTGLCPSCSYSNAQKSNRIAAANRFKEKATKLHNGLYTYEKTKYTKVKEPVQIHCTKCDKFFMQTPDNHLQGKGCPYCAKLTSGAKRRSKYAAIFAGKADALHPGAYDYSLVQYTYANAKVKITCNTCLTTFEQTPNDHLCGRGCPECKNISDYDTLYIWNIPDTDIYKIGVTSKRLGMERINSVAVKIGITPKELAHVFREYLGLEVIKNKNPKEILREYKSRIEQKMFVPIVEYPLKAEDVRAFSMYSDISIIVLNEKDRPELKLFSLFHEIGHLLTKSSALCSIEIELENRGIESYCNRFSAEFLVPENDLKTEIESRDLSLFDQDAVSELAKVYGVSKQVIMIRLLRFGYINKKDYEQFKSRYEESKKELEKRKRFGRRNWEEVFFNRAGGLVISEMKKAYKRGEITPVDVATALEMRTKYVEKFIEG